jgi:hypothetical protein
VKSAILGARNLPDGVEVLLFGSVCYRAKPKDVDILFIYDATSLRPEAAYARLRPFIDAVTNDVGIRVHSTILSREEAQASRFVELVEPVALEAIG